MKEKIKEIEVLRGLSFIAVVIQHVLGYFNLQPGLNYLNIISLTLILTVTRFAIPTFVFITGFVLFYNYYQHLDTGKYTAKRIKDTLIPYVCWSLFFGFSSAVSAGKNINLTDFVSTTVINLIKGTAMYHLWYIAMILQMYFVFPFLRKLFIRLGNKVIYLVAALGLLDISISFIAAQIIPVYLENNNVNWATAFFTDYRHIIFISWLFYFCLGGVAALNYDKFKQWLINYKSLCSVFFGLYASYIAIKTTASATLNNQGYSVNFNVSAPLNLNMYAYSVFAILLFYYLSYILKETKYLNKLLFLVSKHSYGAYLIHPLFISIICKNNLIKWNLSFYFQLITNPLLSCSLSLAASYIISRIPVINILLIGAKNSFTKKNSSVFPHNENI